MRLFLHSLVVVVSIWMLSGCASTDLVESPKTTYVAETGPLKNPQIIWTSRELNRPFDYLGRVESRSWTYEGALERLVDGGKNLRADAIVDIHYEPVGFLSTMQAFAIKFKE